MSRRNQLTPSPLLQQARKQLYGTGEPQLGLSLGLDVLPLPSLQVHLPHLGTSLYPWLPPGLRQGPKFVDLVVHSQRSSIVPAVSRVGGAGHRCLGAGLAPHVTLSPSLLPGSILPVTVYDQHGFRVLFHFARDPLPGRSDVLVVVVSMLSTAPQPIRNIVFQSAVPKVTWACLPPIKAG